MEKYFWDYNQALALKELGYDLDELACKEIGIDISVINHIDKKVLENDSVSTPINEAGALGASLYHQVKGFEIGFQKALEILSDKKFSEEDMIEFAKWVFLEVGSNTGKDRTNKELFDEWFEQFKKK